MRTPDSMMRPPARRGVAARLALMGILMAGCQEPVTAPRQSAATMPVMSMGGSVGTIVFASNREDGFQIWRMDADGSNPKRLTPTMNGSNSRPAVSPSGKEIAFTSTFEATRRQIWLMNADGSNLRRIVEEEDESFESVNWSPTGKQLTYSRGVGADLQDVWVMNRDGSDQVNVTNRPDAYDGRPAWSPNGKQIAFESRRHEGGGTEIYLMNADGSDVRRLTFMREGLADPGITRAVEPAWSPNGKQIAFASNRDRAPGTSEFHIWVINVDGTGLRRITDGPFDDSRPSWSSSGKHLVLDRHNPEGGFDDIDIYVVALDGLGLTNLTMNAEARDIHPIWTR